MTETEWLTAREPWGLLAFVREGGASKRKLRLFTCACCRQVLNPFVPRAAERTLDAAEAFADGAISAELLNRVSAAGAAAFGNARDADRQNRTGYLTHLMDAFDAAFSVRHRSAGEAASGAILAAARAAADMPWPTTGVTPPEFYDELANQTELFRDIFGNPFQSVGIELEWLTETVVALARGIYAERAFDRMPILADALQDAGCDEEELLAHCRDEREHVRGCWVVDLLLGKG